MSRLNKRQKGQKLEKPEITAFIFVFALFVFFASFIGMELGTEQPKIRPT